MEPVEHSKEEFEKLGEKEEYTITNLSGTL